MAEPGEVVALAAQESYGRIVATLIRVTGDWELAEDCAQEAMATALEKWPADGVPANPGGWLMTVARNRALDVLRRTTVERRKLHDIAVLAGPAADDREEDIVDDRLRLIFTCCHPALALEARVALTLRTVAGVPTVDIANAFLVSEPTMTRRLTRAKTKIARAGIPYRVPAGAALAERLPGVLAVLYLLFTRGYNPSGEPAFADEAIRLARLLDRLMPGQPEVSGLLALFLYQHSRRNARRDAEGNLLTLDKQDRALWDRAMIAEGDAILAATDVNGPYVLQARIAACHAAGQTDWAAVARWYDDLAGLQPTAVIKLNRAVAHGFAYGPAAGLTLLAEARSGGELDEYFPAVAAEAELTARTGDRARAARLFTEAADMTTSDAERRALRDRAVEHIGFDRRGTGPVIILIGGAGQFRAVDPATGELTDLLGGRGWTAIHYDRPGRGDSAGTPPYTLAGEIAAIRALVDAHGGAATLYGSSSGAAIALAAAAEIPGVRRLLLWEAPLGPDGGTDGAEFLARIREVVAGGDPEQILGAFMADMPPEWLQGMRDGEHWPLYARMAPTVEADAEALAWTQSRPRRELWAGITAPTTVLLGRDAFPFFHDAADSIVAALPDARRVTVEGSGHGWAASDMADAIVSCLDDLDDEEK